MSEMGENEKRRLLADRWVSDDKNLFAGQKGSPTRWSKGRIGVGGRTSAEKAM